MLRLIMRRGPTPGAIYELEADEITIGRGSKNQIIIRDNEVSRIHCRMVRAGDDYELSDLNSSNGTFVNGQRVIGSWKLTPGAIIELGDSVTLEYERLPVNLPVTPVKSDAGSGEASAASAAPPAETAAEGAAKEASTGQLAAETNLLTIDKPIKRVLRFTGGSLKGQNFTLKDAIITIGRDPSNDIVIQEPEISRYHLRLRRLKQGYSIEDMGSTNGTFVNGTAIDQPRALFANDVIRLGADVTMQYDEMDLGEGSKHDTEEHKAVSTDKLKPEKTADSKADAEKPAAEKQDAKPETTTAEAPAAVEAPQPAPAAALASDTVPDGKLAAAPPPSSEPKTSRLGTGLLPGGLSNHIMIAYGREDWPTLVAPLMLTIQDLNMPVWVDQYLAVGSDDWKAGMDQALKECRVLIVVASPTTISQTHVRDAYLHFFKHKRPVIVLNNGVKPLPSDLTTMRIIDYDSAEPRRSFQRLVFELMHLHH